MVVSVGASYDEYAALFLAAGALYATTPEDSELREAAETLHQFAHRLGVKLGIPSEVES